MLSFPLETKQTPSKQELIERDWCDNAAEIGVVIEKTERQALHLCATSQVPAFKQGGRWKMRPSRHRRHIEELEDATLAARIERRALVAQQKELNA